jgi:hypothetical protein
MDDRRFDQLTRLFGQGASRRTLIKGFLGIGGAAAAGSVVADQAGARDARTRPTIPEPPPPATTTSSTTTPAPCPPGEEQCPNSTVCCPAGTCARSGNQAICCTGHVCGRECCVATDQYRFPSYACCDRECCAADHTCLTRVFPEGSNVEEEMCCPAHLACDNQCCDGACFDPIQGPVWYEETEEFFLNGHPVRVAQTSCCPEGNTVCRVDFNGWQCCSGDTPKCCPVDYPTETPGACRPAGACCDAADCAADNPGTDASCWTCNAGTCVPVLNDVICGESQICCDQVCCAAGQICVEAPSGEIGPAQESHICVTTTTTTTPDPNVQVIIQKRHSETLESLTDACFEFHTGACPASGTIAASGCVQGPSDPEPGWMTVSIPLGTYCLIENEWPEGYDPAGPTTHVIDTSVALFVPNSPTTTTPAPTTTTGFPIICTMGTCAQTGLNSECPIGLLCHEQLCCVVPQPNLPCATSVDCPSGYICNAIFICEAPQATTTTPPPCGTEGCTCVQTSDCNAGLVCLTTGKICASCVPTNDGPCGLTAPCCASSNVICPSPGGSCVFN